MKVTNNAFNVKMSTGCLSRHENTKYALAVEPTMADESIYLVTESPLKLKSSNASVVAKDIGLPETTQEVLKSFHLSTEEANIWWKKIGIINNEFNTQNNYSQFCGLLGKNIFL